jgi:hypothetical protein
LSNNLEQNGNGNGRVETIAPFLAQAAGRGVSLAEEDFNALSELLSVGKNPKDIDARTDVNMMQIIHIARGRTMGEHYKWNALDSFISNILTLSLSRDRKSRLEFTHAVRAVMSGGMDEQNSFTQKMMESLRR